MTTDKVALLVGTGVVSFALSYAGAAVGLILGHLRLPLLVYTLGSPIAGASTNLAVSGAGAVAGAWKHVREGRVSGTVMLLMGLPSVVGSAAGVVFFVSVDLFWSHLAIGAMLLLSGVGLLRSKKDGEPGGGLPDRWVIPAEVALGFGLGIMAAVTGLMLGTMRLPMMIRWLKVDPAVAVGSNMLIGCLTAVTAAGTAFLAGGGLDPAALLIVGPPTILGSYLGAKLTGKLSKEKLKRMVGGIVAVTGVFMCGQAGQHALRRPPKPGHPTADPLLVEELPDLRAMDEDRPDPSAEPLVEPLDPFFDDSVAPEVTPRDEDDGFADADRT